MFGRKKQAPAVPAVFVNELKEYETIIHYKDNLGNVDNISGITTVCRVVDGMFIAHNDLSGRTFTVPVRRIINTISKPTV